MQQNIINKIKELPKSWDDLSFAKYLLILNSKSIEDDYKDDDDDSIIKHYQRAKEAIRTLTDIPIETIEQLPMSVINEALNGLGFMSQPMPKATITHQLKKVGDITFQNFIDYINYSKNVQSYYQNFTKILPIFVTISEEEILNSPAYYVFALVDDVKKKMNKLMMILMLLTATKIIKMKIQKMIGKVKLIFKKNK